jgi:hypothetical protein
VEIEAGRYRQSGHSPPRWKPLALAAYSKMALLPGDPVGLMFQ